jgi:hypothetical protein
MIRFITMTQDVIEALGVQFWYGILNKELKWQVWDAILFNSTQSPLVGVF